MQASYNNQLVRGQVCPDYDGKSIGLPKCSSLFGIRLGGGILNLVLFIVSENINCVIILAGRPIIRMLINKKTY